jgi:hypothetical protein
VSCLGFEGTLAWPPCENGCRRTKAASQLRWSVTSVSCSLSMGASGRIVCAFRAFVLLHVLCWQPVSFAHWLTCRQPARVIYVCVNSWSCICVCVCCEGLCPAASLDVCLRMRMCVHKGPFSCCLTYWQLACVRLCIEGLCSAAQLPCPASVCECTFSHMCVY